MAGTEAGNAVGHGVQIAEDCLLVQPLVRHAASVGKHVGQQRDAGQQAAEDLQVSVVHDQGALQCNTVARGPAQ